MKVTEQTRDVIRGVDGRAQGVGWRSHNDFITPREFC